MEAFCRRRIKTASERSIGKILEATEKLASNPFPSKIRKLVGSEQSFRIRIGDYRGIYSVFSKILTIEIIRIGHPRDIYR